MRGGMGGQAVEPGTYAVKLTAGGKVLTGKVTVRLDPIQDRRTRSSRPADKEQRPGPSEKGRPAGGAPFVSMRKTPT